MNFRPQTLLRKGFRKISSPFRAAPSAYQARILAEKDIYNDNVNVHELPQIFHYWSDRYVRPKLEAFGISNPDALFIQQFERQCRRDLNAPNSFVSIGSGNCDVEIATAAALAAKGLTNFTIECLDLNETMLARGKQLAAERRVLPFMKFAEGDFNDWRPKQGYDAVMANQALHHVVNLESLFDSIKRSLKPAGLLVTSDMIGRNGHLRWPEALKIVHEYWRTLPEKYRYNHQLERREKLYENWDCSQEGFEGVRAQDILPLLLERFHFQLFIAFGNVIDVFVDRGFGHNFDAASAEDRAFIDRVEARDEAELLSGRLKPTHMLAVLGNEPAECLHHPPLTAEFCVRRP